MLQAIVASVRRWIDDEGARFVPVNRGVRVVTLVIRPEDAGGLQNRTTVPGNYRLSNYRVKPSLEYVPNSWDTTEIDPVWPTKLSMPLDPGRPQFDIVLLAATRLKMVGRSGEQ